MENNDKNAFQKVKDNERRYHHILMHSPFAISVTKGKDMVITMANELMKEFWGKGHDVEEKPLFQFLPELLDQPFPAMMESVYTTGNPLNANEISVPVMRDGVAETRYYNIFYQPYLEADKTISGVTTMAYDVTEQVLARKKIEESEMHFRKMADIMPAKISNANPDGEVIYFNQHWLDYTGMSFEELKEFGYHKIMHPEEMEEFQNRLHAAAQKGTTLEMEMRFLNKKGEYKWHLNLVTPILDEHGQVSMWIGSTTEIHKQVKQKISLAEAVKARTVELEKANRELTLKIEENEKHAAELTSANKALVAFAYVSSHDLQEPLRKIQTFADRLYKDEVHKLSDTGKRDFERILLSAGKMRHLIDDLLAYSRVNTTHANRIDTDITDIIEEIKCDLDDIIHEKQAVITVEPLCTIKIVPFQFKQLFQNLISNSLKFSSPERSPKMHVSSVVKSGAVLNHPELSVKEDYCHISFTDNGIGFDPQYAHRIFEVFQRLHNYVDYKGTGIGLAIVKKIVENHFGVITVTSKVGEGTTFDIYIPA